MAAFLPPQLLQAYAAGMAGPGYGYGAPAPQPGPPAGLSPDAMANIGIAATQRSSPGNRMAGDARQSADGICALPEAQEVVASKARRMSMVEQQRVPSWVTASPPSVPHSRSGSLLDQSVNRSAGEQGLNGSDIMLPTPIFPRAGSKPGSMASASPLRSSAPSNLSPARRPGITRAASIPVPAEMVSTPRMSGLAPAPAPLAEAPTQGSAAPELNASEVTRAGAGAAPLMEVTSVDCQSPPQASAAVTPEDAQAQSGLGDADEGWRRADTSWI